MHAILRMPMTCFALSVAACAESQVIIPDEQKKPELVRPGMSLRQVEVLMGSSDKKPCWNYQRNGAAERICFIDGLANLYRKSPLVEPDPTKITINAWFAGVWPPKQLPSPKATEVTIGTSQKRVEELWGAPASVDDTFSMRNDSYRGTFVQGRLTKFEDVPMPPMPRVF